MLPTEIKYLYNRLFAKLSDEGFQDVWSIGGFIVVFIFCTLVITVTLGIIISWCFCEGYRILSKSNRVQVQSRLPFEKQEAIIEERRYVAQGLKKSAYKKTKSTKLGKEAVKSTKGKTPPTYPIKSKKAKH